MVNFNQSLVETIKQRADIVEVISSYVDLKRASQNYIGLCPFHNEKTPSFNVNADKQFFHCFGCKESGDVISFISKLENLDFKDALFFLATRYGIEVDKPSSPSQKQYTSQREQLYKIHTLSATWFAEQLNSTEGKKAYQYLQKRNISDKEISQFQIGYAPESWDKLLNYLKGEGFDEQILKKSGLFVQKEQSSKLYDRFRDRVMFSICNRQGQVIGFSGRVLSDEKEQAKYVNSPETDIFQKKQVVYAYHLARKNFKKHKFALLCEGQIDVIACHRAGFDNAVSSQGTALTQEHARVISRYADGVTLAFDGDSAGIEASLKSLETFAPFGLIPKICQLEEKLDPDTILNKYGVQVLQKNISQAKDFFDFAFDILKEQEGYQTPQQKANVVRKLAQYLSKVNDFNTREFYIQKISYRKLKVNVQEFRKIFKKEERKGFNLKTEQKKSVQNTEKFDEPLEARTLRLDDLLSQLELRTLGLALISAEIAGKLASKLAEVKFGGEFGELLNEFLGLVNMQEWEKACELVKSAGNQNPILASLLVDNSYSQMPDDRISQEIEQSVKNVLDMQKKERLAQLNYQLKDPNLSKEQRTDLFQEFMKLRSS